MKKENRPIKRRFSSVLLNVDREIDAALSY
jgi:hypothetical protein